MQKLVAKIEGEGEKLGHIGKATGTSDYVISDTISGKSKNWEVGLEFCFRNRMD